MFLLVQRALAALCLISLFGCSTTRVRQWEIQEIITKTPGFNGSKLLLSPDSDSCHLEIEILRNSSGIWFYINLLFLEALPWAEDSARTRLNIFFNDQETWTLYPYLLEGGQRLLFPDEIAEVLIQSLLAEQLFTIQIGRSQLPVISSNFAELYQRLLDLPI